MPREPDDLDPDAAADARAIELGSRLDDDDFELFDPPAEVWQGITARLHDGPDASEGAVARTDRIEQSPAPPPVVLEERRRRGWRVAAAAAIVVALAAGGVLLAIRDSDPPSRTVARVTLEVLKGDATATARLVQEDGHEVLVIDAHDMPAAPAGSHFELWLIDQKLTDPRSLGPMTGSTRVRVPRTIDTGQYDVVDISLQPDGLRKALRQ